MCILPLLPCHHCLLMDVRKMIANNFFNQKAKPFFHFFAAFCVDPADLGEYPPDIQWMEHGFSLQLFFSPQCAKVWNRYFLLNIMNILLICHLFVISILGFLEKLVPQTVNCSTQQQHPKQYQQQPADKQQKAANDSFKKEEKGAF